MMWMLHLLPDSVLFWAINIVLIVGIVAMTLGFFVKFLPPIRHYKLPLQILGMVLLISGVYFKGGYSTEIDWRERVAEMEKKVAAAEEKSRLASSQIETKIVTQIKIIKQNVGTTKIILQKNKQVIDKECTVNDTAFTLYNRAVTNGKEATATNGKEAEIAHEPIQ